MFNDKIKEKIKQLIILGKTRENIGKASGYLTYDEINNCLKLEDYPPESLDELYITLAESGIIVLEAEQISKRKCQELIERKAQEILEDLVTIGKKRGYLTYDEIYSDFFGKREINELYGKIEKLGIKIVDQNAIRKQEFLKKILTIGKEKGYLTYNQIDELYLEEKLLVYNDINELYTKIEEKGIKIVEQNLKVDAIKRKKQELLEILVSLEKEKGYITYNEINNELFRNDFNYVKENRKYISSVYRTLAKLEIKIFDRLGKELFGNLIPIGKRQGYVIFDDIRAELDEKNLQIETITYFHAIQKKFGFKVVIDKEQIYNYLRNISEKNKVSELKKESSSVQNDKKLPHDKQENSNCCIVLKSKERILENTFNKLNEKQKDMIIKRYYYENTLEDIGKKYKITRERARQILVKIENRLFDRTKPNINRFVLELKQIISNLNIVTKKELCENLKEYGNSQILIIYINYFIHEYKYEYVKEKDFVISSNINLKKIKEILESISIVTIEYIYKQLEIKFKITSEVIDRLFIVLDKFILKKRYFINPTIPNKILYLFYIEQRPIHISELENLYEREFNSTNVMHNLHAHVQRINDISRYDRGTYVLKESINNEILSDKDFIKKIKKLLKNRNAILHINFIKEQIVSKYSLSEIKYLLDSSKYFKNFERDYYGLSSWKNKKREYIKDIIYKYIKEQNKPVNICQIEEKLKECGKNIQQYSIYPLMSKCGDFKKIAPSVWGLVSWKKYPEYVPIKVPNIMKIKIINCFLRNCNNTFTGQYLFTEMKNFFSFKSSAIIYNILKDNLIFEKTEKGYKLLDSYYVENKTNYKLQLIDIPKILFSDFYKCLKNICCSHVITNNTIDNYINTNNLINVKLKSFIDTYKSLGYVNNSNYVTKKAVQVHNNFYEEYCDKTTVSIKIDDKNEEYDVKLLRYLYYDIINTDFGSIFFSGKLEYEEIKTIFYKYFEEYKENFEEYKDYVFSWINSLQIIKKFIIDTKEEQEFEEEEEEDMNKEDTFFSYYDYLKSFIKKLEGGMYSDTIKYFPEVFKLLVQLLEIKDLNVNTRILINCAVAYIVVPNDVFPETEDSPIGFMDDLFVGLYVINKLLNSENKELILNLKKEYDFLNKFDSLYEDTKNILKGYTDEILNFAGIVE